jgi:hypothetical protein
VNAQDAVAALLATLALAWLFSRWWRSRRRGATACAHCPAATTVAGVRPAPQPELLLVIGEPSRPAPPSPADSHAP